MMGSDVWPVLMRSLNHPDRFVRNGAAEVFQNLGVLDSLIVMEAATDNPGATKIDMLRRIADAGGVRFTDSLVERAGPIVGPRIRNLLATIGLAACGSGVIVVIKNSNTENTDTNGAHGRIRQKSVVSVISRDLRVGVMWLFRFGHLS